MKTGPYLDEMTTINRGDRNDVLGEPLSIG